MSSLAVAAAYVTSGSQRKGYGSFSQRTRVQFQNLVVKSFRCLPALGQGFRVGHG